jgi:sialate O-acetylesterase
MKQKIRISFLSLWILVFAAASTRADVRLPRIFSSNMVLQQGSEIPVWGNADRNERVTILFNGVTLRAKADKNGSWRVNLPAQNYGGPYTLTVKGNNTVEFENVMIGEVWVCSGQSNMQWTVKNSNDSDEEIAAADYPNIRLFYVPREVAQFPQTDISDGEWVECSPETIPEFSAVAYYFGRSLYQDLNVPVGLIHTSWGGTVAETWISPSAMSIDPDFGAKFNELQEKDQNEIDKKNPNAYPALLYNAMIQPLIPYAMKGAIWYQGESNAGRAKQYQRIFPGLINDWRNQWKQGDFPFLFVSLANFRKPVEQPADSDWAELREAQTMALSLPNTGMALAIDIGDADDIHPRNKQDVGKRLALNALKIAYDKEVVNSGPLYKSVEIKNGKAYITFTETGSGLQVNDKYGYLKGFTIAGADRVFHWAKAEQVDAQTVVVYSDEVSNPVAVRYGWANNPDDVNLYNKEGLPANPFRTDQWPGITK